MAATAAKRAPEVTESVVIELPALKIETAVVTLVGDSPLICHAWSQKAKTEMLDKQMRKAKQGRAAKNPQEDYEQSLYKMPEGSETQYGFPAVAFKSSAVDACSHISGITKVISRGAFHIDAELVPIFGDPTPREDMVRLSGLGSTADIRYRGEFKKWHTEFLIRFNSNIITLPQILNLFNTAGFGIGVGEWRPQKDGNFGMFHVATEGDSRQLKLRNR